MKAGLRIIKGYHRNKNLNILLVRAVFAPHRQFYVRMNGSPWPTNGHLGSSQRDDPYPIPIRRIAQCCWVL